MAVAGTIYSRVPTRSGLGIWRRSILAVLLAGALVALAGVLVLGGGASHSKPPAHKRSGVPAGGAAAPSASSPGSVFPSSAAASSSAAGSSAASSGSHASGHTHGSRGAVGARANVAQVPDPQESKSFPAPASVHHTAAATPAAAGALAIAAGAPSDAEVRHELAQMQAVERRALQAQRQQLSATAGGASIGGNGSIPIPQNVPEVIQKVVAGANAIADFPYVFGGGHASFVDNAYDCSGSVSYALAAGGLLSAPETSGELESWGAPGPGRYITVLANAGHTYMYVNGAMFNTAGRSGVYASRWQLATADGAGFAVRHWPGL